MKGTLPDGTPVPRHSAETCNQSAAETYRAKIIQKFTKSTADDGISISQAIDDYLESKRDDIGDRTAGQYRLVLDRFQEHCAKQAVAFMSQLTVNLIDKYSSSLKGLSTTRAQRMNKISAFLRDALRREWITKPLAQQIKPVTAIYEEKKPYTKAEVDLILAGCEGMKKGNKGDGYASQPKTFRLLLELMLETGLRAGDAIRFDPSVLVLSDTKKTFVYRFLPQKRKKNAERKYVDVTITHKMKDAIDTCNWLSQKLPFSFGNFTLPTYLANEVYYRMQAIGDRVGVEDCRPHRLRDTFAVRLLEQGFTLDDVQRLLHHSSVRITEKFYGRWSNRRSINLESKLLKVLV